MSKLSIRARLYLLVVLAVLATLLVGVVSSSGIRNYGNSVKDIVESNNPEMMAAAAMRLEISERARFIRNVILFEDPAQVQNEVSRIAKSREKYDKAEAALDRLFAGQSVPVTDKEKELQKKIKELKSQLDPLVQKEVDFALKGEKKEAADVLLKEIRPVQAGLLDTLGTLFEFEQSENDSSAKEARRAGEQALLVSYVTIAVAAALLFVLGTLIVHSIMKPLLAMQEAMREIGEQKDFTRRINLSGNDELARTARIFDAMVLALQAMLNGMRADAGHVENAAKSLANSSTQIAESSSHQAGATSAMASAVEQVTVSAATVADNAQESREVSGQSRRISEEGHVVISNAMQAMSDVAGTIQNVTLEIRHLGEQSQHISSVVQVIKEVADQTNLLALNAAIEAARAGEMGRGFAVVADEVRKLAERTAGSTQEISTVVAAIQQSAKNAVRSSDQAAGQVHGVVALAQEAADIMGKVNSSVAQAERSIADISDSLSEQRVANLSIARQVEVVSQMTEQNSAAAASSADLSKQLRQLAEHMASAVKQFRLA